VRLTESGGRLRPGRADRKQRLGLAIPAQGELVRAARLDEPLGGRIPGGRIGSVEETSDLGLREGAVAARLGEDRARPVVEGRQELAESFDPGDAEDTRRFLALAIAPRPRDQGDLRLHPGAEPEDPSPEPDVVEFSLDRPETIADAVTTLDRPVTFLRPSIGLTTIDVADVAGAVVIGVDSNGAAAGIQSGDVIVKVNDQAVANSAAVLTALSTRAANDALSLELKDKAGASKKADVKVLMTPRVIGMSDQMLLANRLVADFRTRLLVPANAAEESIIRLNLAAALARLQA
jgi:hypothetical protein